MRRKRKRMSNETRAALPGVGEVLRKCREELGLSQREVGEKARVDKSLISKYENEKAFPSTKTLEKIAPVLGQDVIGLVLLTLQQRYPSLARSEAGRLMIELGRHIQSLNKD